MEIKANEIKLVDTASLIPNSKNPNYHSPEQLQMLSEIIKYQGFRSPIVVSNRSGFVVAGHGRLEAAKILGMLKVPVIYQDFENEAQEYAHVVADNAIAEWAQLNIEEIKIETLKLPEIQLPFLGLKKSLNEETKIKENVDDVKQFIITVFCKNESEMQKLYVEFLEKGLECKLIT